MNVLLVGKGRVGSQLAAMFRRADVSFSWTSGRKLRVPVRADLAILAVRDAAIGSITAALMTHPRRPAVVLHTSGSRGTDAFGSGLPRPVALGVLHPAASFPTARPTLHAEDVVFVVDGASAAVHAARQLGRRLDARIVVAPRVHGATYHAGCAMLANGAVALAEHAVRAFRAAGMSEREAARTAAALLTSVARNVTALAPADALTGPIERGDADLVAAHRAALRRTDRKLDVAYTHIAHVIVDTASRKPGVSKSDLARVRRVLRER